MTGPGFVKRIRSETLGMNHTLALPAVDRAEGRAFTATSRVNDDRLFRKAARHSRLIRALRIAIPAGVVAALGLILAVALNPFQAPAKVAFDKGKLAVSGTKITMELPRLTGFTSDGLPYELNAKVASQDLANPGVLELSSLSAKVQTKDQGAIRISAATGVFNVKSDLLRLVDNVLVESSMGYEARLHEATVDMKKGTIVSEHRVETKFPEGTLKANRVEVSESGAVVVFSQGVETILASGQETWSPFAPASQ
jgi:lipopolysaccharide export system protein LptC